MINFFKNFIQKILSYLNLTIINNDQKIIELSEKDRKLIDIVSNYSMTPRIRIYNLLQALKHVKQNSIEGDFVECGVWKGGNIIMFRKFQENIARKLGKYFYKHTEREPMILGVISEI